MSDELRERVCNAITRAMVEAVEPDVRAYGMTRAEWNYIADAAIAIIRAEVLEEAARIVEQYGEDAGMSAQYDQRDSDAEFTCEQAAAAIRALKDA